jgi:hypothetical protein
MSRDVLLAEEIPQLSHTPAFGLEKRVRYWSENIADCDDISL